MLLERLLKQPGRTVFTASSGAAACKIASENHLACIILDVQMPEMDGFEAAEILRRQERSAHVPIILVTATHCEQEQMFKGYESGAVDYLLKPLPPRLLQSKVDVFCQLYQQRAVIQNQLDAIRNQKEALERQFAELKMLRGLIPLCVSCKKVRDDSGYWEQIETYLRDRSDAEFSHAVCPDCSEKLYPELYTANAQNS